MAERKARIAHVTWTFGGTQEGISRSVTELARDQARWGDVTVICARAEAGPENVRIVPVDLNILERRLPFSLGFAAASRRALRRAGPFDIVHAHVPTLFRADVATVHLFPPRRLIAMVRDTLSRTNQPLPDDVRKRLRFVGLTDWTYRRNMGPPTRLIAVSDRVADALASEYALERSSITTVPLGISAPPGPAASVKRPQGARRVALFVGHQYVTKGLGFVIDALAGLGADAPHLVVIGEGSEGSRRAMEDYARTRGVAHLIRFDGVQPSVWDYYAMADFLIYPTFFDTFGLVIGEALASGCPVITTKAAGISDLLQSSPALRIMDHADDVAALMDAIQALAPKTEVRETAIAGVASLICEKHSKAVANIYNTILKQTKRR